MTVGELKIFLDNMNQEEEIVLAWSRDGVACVDELEFVDFNGGFIQLTGRSLMEDNNE